jgi:catechol 2,3-dioxygenase-like lactoylglutathione lyase family enzyme
VAKHDHLALTVGDLIATRDWYSTVLGLEVEFDTGKVSGLTDEGGFTLILSQDSEPPSRCSFYLQVPDVQIAYDEMTGRGVAFRYPPRNNDWGYGAGLTHPDGRLVGLWDEKSMRDHESA